MLHKEMMLCATGGENNTYTVTVANIGGEDFGGLYGFALDQDDFPGGGSMSPSTFDGGTINQFCFVQIPFGNDGITTDWGNITLNGLVCFVVFTTKTTTSTLKFTRLDTNTSVTTSDCKAGSLDGKSFLAWAVSGAEPYSGLFFEDDVGKTIKVKIEKV